MNNTNATSSQKQLAEVIVGTAVLALLMTVTVAGNILVVYSIFTYRPLKRVQNFYLVSLAATDMAVSLFVVPFQIGLFVSNSWRLGTIVCRIFVTADVLLCTVSIWHLCAIAFDRFLAICDPINYANRRTKKLVLLQVAGVWALSCLISVPPLLGWNDWESTKEFVCDYTSDLGFVIYSALGSFYIPLIIMLVLYAKIFSTAKARLEQHKSTVRRGLTATGTLRTTRDNRRRVRAIRKITSQEELGEGGLAAAQRTFSVPDRGRLVIVPSTDATSSAGVNVLDLDGLEESCVDGWNNTSEPSVEVKQQPAARSSSKKLNKISSAIRLKIKRQATTETEEEGFTEVQTFFLEREKISVAKERKATKTLAIIMICFVGCWLPFFVLYILKPFKIQVPDNVDKAAVWLGYMNSAFNPIIYTVFNQDFQSAFKHILMSRWQRIRQRIQSQQQLNSVVVSKASSRSAPMRLMKT